MQALIVFLVVQAALAFNEDLEKPNMQDFDQDACSEMQGTSMMQRQTIQASSAYLELAKAKRKAVLQNAVSQSYEHAPGADYAQNPVVRSFLGASPVVSSNLCSEDTYIPSQLEQEWTSNAKEWTDASHCDHMTAEDANRWIKENDEGNHSARLFSTICRRGRTPQYIEPLAGILRDPRFGCQGRPVEGDIFSVDWIVLPDSQTLSPGAKARFYDAGGSHFNEALKFFLDTYRGHGILFDEVYVWEFTKQGTESYWHNVDAETRAVWEPYVKFYDGIGVTAEKDSEHNPVSRLFKSCKEEDFCAFKLDIDTASIESPLVQQLLENPDETRAKLDEFFFEHHVTGAMEPWWQNQVNKSATFADSYKIFGDLRKLGVRAHSWV